jgi:cyanophycinase
MSGLLALIGGGEWSEGCTVPRTLLEASGTDEVVLLPTGSAYENPGKLVARAVDCFAALGASVEECHVLTRPDALVPETAERLRAARFIYVAGASAMHLRSVLKDSVVFDAILEAWTNGAVLAGTNAGADALCDPMVDSRGGAFTVGLGVVSNLAVIPRSNTWSHDKIHRTVELAPKGISLIAVPECTALLRPPDGSWSSTGEGEVSVYVEGKSATLADLSA